MDSDNAVDDVVRYLLNYLQDFFTKTAALDDLSRKRNELREELESIQFLIRNLYGKEVKGATIRHWLRELKTLSHGIDDVLEYNSIKVESRKGEGLRKIFRPLTDLLDYYSAVRQVKEQMGSIGGRITDLTEDLKRYGVRPQIEVQTSMSLVPEFEGSLWSKLINDPKPEKDFVAMKKDIETLVSFLVKGGNYQVISLFGMRGFGKTALAKMLFNHPVVRRHFKCFAWVHLTQTFHTHTVLQDILRQLLSGEPIEEAVQVEDIGLFQKVYKVQQEKKCLVVLDNIPSLDAWKILRNAFPFAETTSKVMLTTRFREVVETVAGLGCIHTKNPLSEEDGWELFKKEAFGNSSQDCQVPGMIEVIGRELVRKCRGSPLAINMLGTMISSKRTLDEWKVVYHKIDLHLKIGEITAIPQVLASIHIDLLPDHLKLRFLYLGYFPEESEIEVEKLYLLWIAEGIITPRNLGRAGSMMDKQEDYLDDLHVRGLVEVQEKVTSLKRFRSCRIDWLMRELCLSKAKEEEFLEVIDYGRGSHGITDSFSFDSTYPARQLVIYLDKYKDSCSVPFISETAKYLQFLLVYNAHEDQKGSVLPEEISDLSYFRVLRVLDFDGVDFREMSLPRGISRLELLRYLSFKGCFLTVLPEQVGRLSRLQILDLRLKSEILVPNVLWKLQRLRYLYLPQKFRTLNHGKLRLDSLIELETLEHFSTKMCNVKDLQKLKNLRYLTADTEESVQDLKGLIERMNTTTAARLSSSIDVRNFDCYTEERHSVFRQLLSCDALRAFSIEGQIRQIPSFNKISKSLTEIIFIGSGLKEDPMLALGKLPRLRMLVLNDDAFLGEKMVCTASSFPELKWLELSNLCSLKNWTIQNGALARLSTLTFESCRGLETVPGGLKWVASLAKLNIRKMPQTFQEGIRAWKKITKYPTILRID